MGQLTTQMMSRLTAAGVLANLDDAVQSLADMKAVHLCDYTGDEEGMRLGKPNEASEQIGRDLNRYRSASTQLDVEDPRVPLKASSVRQQLGGDLSKIVDEIISVSDRMESVDSELSSIEEEQSALALLAPLDIDLELLSGYDSLTTFTGTVKDASAARASAGEGLAFVVGTKPTVVAVFCENDAAAEVQSALEDAGFVASTVPEGEGSIVARLSELSSQSETLFDERANLQASLDGLSAEDGVTLLGGIEMLERDMQLALGPMRVATSEHAFVIDGWVETSRSDEIQEVLSDSCLYVDIEPFKITPGGGGHGLHDTEVELPPIKFADRDKTKPMELITDLMGRPRYGKVDPTLFIFFTYPLFFGLMLGDMAYGAATMLIALLLYRSIGHTENGFLASKFVAYIGFSAILFGYLYGEIAGFVILPHGHCVGEGFESFVTAHACEAAGGHWGWIESHAPDWLAWLSFLYPNGGEFHWTTNDLEIFSFAGVHGLPFGLELAYPYHRVLPAAEGGNLEGLVLLTIYMGVFHVLLGLCIGFRDIWLYGDSHGNAGPLVAIFDRGSWLLLLIGGFMFAYSFMVLRTSPGDQYYVDFLSSMGSIGAVLMAVGLLFLIYAGYKYHGMPPVIAAMIGPIEGVGIMSNVISYVRLFAVGVAGVKIAETGNEMLYGHVDSEGHATGLIGVIENLSHHDISGTMLLLLLLPVILPFVVKFGKISLPGNISFGKMFLAGFLLTGILGYALGVGSSLFMLLVLLFGWLLVQVFALGLGLLSPNIHTTRLHLVEWMKQFYEVAGEKFSPFGFTAAAVEVE